MQWRSVKTFLEAFEYKGEVLYSEFNDDKRIVYPESRFVKDVKDNKITTDNSDILGGDEYEQL